MNDLKISTLRSGAAVYVRIVSPTTDAAFLTPDGTAANLRSAAEDLRVQAADQLRRAELLERAADQMEAASRPVLPGLSELYALRDRATSGALTRNDEAQIRALADYVRSGADDDHSASWWDALLQLSNALPAGSNPLPWGLRSDSRG